MLPGATCVVGFLRTYSSFLKLDADAMVEAYKTGFARSRSDEVPIVRTDVTKAPRSRTSAERKKQRVRRQHGSYVIAAVFALVVVALLAWFGTGRAEEAASLSAANITSSTLTTTAPLVGGSSTTSAPSTTAPARTTTTVAGGVVPTDGPIEMVLSVQDEECWLVVREDGEGGAEVFAGTLSAGGKQTFDGAKSYWLMAGNPDVLLVTVEGSAYTLQEPAGTFIVTGAGVERSQ